MELTPKLQIQGQQKQILTQAMRHSLEILQLPQLELGALIQEEIENNPLLELDSSPPRGGGGPIPPDIAAKPSLQEHLLAQMRDVFTCSKDISIAEQLIGSLDNHGLLTDQICPTDEPILAILQTFDPPGIFARSCQETFLIQLERSGQKDSLVFRIVQNHFDDLLHARYGKIEKGLSCTKEELSQAIHKLTRVTTRPASQFETPPVTPIYPDLRILKLKEKWVVQPLEDTLPKFHLKEEYLDCKGLPKDQKELIKGFATSGKWLLRSIQRRRQLITSIGSHLAKIQTAYLDGEGPLVPICPAELATLFGVHESTISRALADKYVASPTGTFALRSLIASHGNEGAKQLLQQIIARENKQKPMTDDEIAAELTKSGHPVARRTVAKYRTQLKISSATTRKHL